MGRHGGLPLLGRLNTTLDLNLSLYARVDERTAMIGVARREQKPPMAAANESGHARGYNRDMNHINPGKLKKNRPSRLPHTPNIPALDELRPLLELDVFDDELYDSVQFGQCVCSSRKALHVVFERSIFERVDFTQARLKRLETSDLDFRRCDFAGVALDNFDGQRLLFQGCRLMGVKIIEGKITDVRFRECQLDLSQMRYSALKGAYFESCSLKDADFSGSDLTGATFADCDLTGASFLNAKLKDCDLRTAKLDDARFGIDDLKGACVTPFQAVMIASVFGLKVLDEHVDL